MATKKVLIADDSKSFRELEGSFLRERGYDLLFAEDGAKAMRLAVEELPDLVLLDIQMPVMDGVQVLAYLKKEQKTQHIPIVVVTTIREPDNVKRLLGAGADAVLSKPIRAAQLWDAVAPFLESPTRP